MVCVALALVRSLAPPIYLPRAPPPRPPAQRAQDASGAAGEAEHVLSLIESPGLVGQEDRPSGWR